jgi:hypothetical protein
MSVSNPHNFAEQTGDEEKRFGIRVRPNETDPFRKLVDANWETVHWFSTAEERDAELKKMSGRHRYSRLGDLPTLIYERVER